MSVVVRFILCLGLALSADAAYTNDFNTSTPTNQFVLRGSAVWRASGSYDARITTDAGQSNQTKQVIGEFRSPPTGNWDIFHTVPLQMVAVGSLI